MTDTELLAACKTGLNIPSGSTVFDGTLTQKLQAVKSLMIGAGVSEIMLSDPLAVGIVVMGVTDIWSLTGGEIKMSAAFYTLLTQLAARSYQAANAFSVTYDGNDNTGGGVPFDSNIYSQGAVAVLLKNFGSLTRTGYTFAGWNTAADGNGKDFDEGDSIAIGVASLTLFAKWEAV